MENIKPRKSNINLKHLPSINNPSFGNYVPVQGRFENSRNFRFIPQFMSSSEAIRAQNLNTISEDSVRSTDFSEFSSYGIKNFEKSSTLSSSRLSSGEGIPEKRAANSKSLLIGICSANKWKPPLFECCKEEGPGHAKIFSFKVIVEMKGDYNSDLESYGAPQTTKKVAAEHAAEGALWYLKHLGLISKG